MNEPDYTKNIRANLKRWKPALDKIGDCRVKTTLAWLEDVCFRYDYLVKRNAKLQAKLDERKGKNGKK